VVDLLHRAPCRQIADVDRANPASSNSATTSAFASASSPVE
jgi:hypothetical protein